MSTEKDVALTVNGTDHELTVEPRTLLVHALREQLDLTGTHIGCDTGNCGACTVLLDGEAVKSCMLFAAQADGSEVRTVEGMADLPEADGDLHPLQEGFKEMHGLQCGFCTPGMIMAGEALLEENPDPTEAEIRRAISGNLCRCTGYQNIVKSVEYAADVLNDREPPEAEAEAATDGGVRVEGDAAGDGGVETDGGVDVASDAAFEGGCGAGCGCASGPGAPEADELTGGDQP